MHHVLSVLSLQQTSEDSECHGWHSLIEGVLRGTFSDQASNHQNAGSSDAAQGLRIQFDSTRSSIKMVGHIGWSCDRTSPFQWPTIYPLISSTEYMGKMFAACRALTHEIQRDAHCLLVERCVFVSPGKPSYPLLSDMAPRWVDNEACSRKHHGHLGVLCAHVPLADLLGKHHQADRRLSPKPEPSAKGLHQPLW